MRRIAIALFIILLLIACSLTPRPIIRDTILSTSTNTPLPILTATLPATLTPTSSPTMIATQTPTATRFIRVHLIVEGETLRKIANYYYAEESLWVIIYEENKERIGRDPNLIIWGTKLVIP